VFCIKIIEKFPKILYSTILKNKKYDVEFAAIHGMRDDILNSPIKSSKKIVWIHNDLRKTEFHNYTNEEIRKFFGFDKIMVISEHIQKDFENLAKNESEKSKIVRIYNPIDTEEILKKSDASTPLSMTNHHLIHHPSSNIRKCRNRFSAKRIRQIAKSSQKIVRRRLSTSN
jgi:glycosyltransferase involved in cell wall biosynthesis